MMWASLRLAGFVCIIDAYVTAGRELHPAPKVSVISMSYSEKKMQEGIPISLPVLSPVKFLCVRHSIFSAKVSKPCSDQLLHLLCSSNELAGVTEQRFDLYLHYVRDIDEVIHIRCTHNVNFRYFMRKQALI